MPNNFTTRVFNDYGIPQNENESEGEGKGLIVGTPIVFEQKTDIGGWFQETIASGAITYDALRDVAFFLNHELDLKPHARTRNKTLTFEISDSEVRMEAHVNMERQDSKDLYLTIKDQTMDGMSFMFVVDEEEWSDLDSDYPSRRITKIGYVREVSAVTYPAYEGTFIDARGKLDSDRNALDKARKSLVDTNTVRQVELLKLKNNNYLRR